MHFLASASASASAQAPSGICLIDKQIPLAVHEAGQLLRTGEFGGNRHVQTSLANMTFSILPVSMPEDALTLSSTHFEAFAEDPLFTAGFPTPMTAEQRQEFIAWRSGLLIQRCTRPGKHYFKAVDDETGHIVAFSGWAGPSKQRHEKEDDQSTFGGMPAFLKREFYEEFDRALAEVKKRALGDRDDLCGELWRASAVNGTQETWLERALTDVV